MWFLLFVATAFGGSRRKIAHKSTPINTASGQVCTYQMHAKFKQIEDELKVGDLTCRDKEVMCVMTLGEGTLNEVEVTFLILIYSRIR